MSERGFFWHFFLYLLPLLALCLGIEGYLLARWPGKSVDFASAITVPVGLALRYAVAYLVILILAIFASAQFLKLASDSFNVRASYLQSFTLMAYAFGPTILARILDGFPPLNTWVCWAIGAAVSVSVLYHGIGMILKPEQTKGFGLYLVCLIIVVLMSALAHFVALAILRGQVLGSRTAEVPAAVRLAGAGSAQRLVDDGTLRVILVP